MSYNNIVISTLDLEQSKYMDEYVHRLSKSFSKNYNKKDLLAKYKENHKGYSVHSISIFEERIVASFTCMPRKIENISILVGCDTFVDKNHRNNIFLLKDLYKILINSTFIPEYKFLLGIPNEKASLYWDKIANWKKVDELDIVILPVISGFLKYFFATFYYLITILFYTNNKCNMFQNINFLGKFKYYNRVDDIFTKNYIESKVKITYLFGFCNNFRLQLAKNIFISIINNGNSVSLIAYKNPLRLIRLNRFIKRKLNIHIEYFDKINLDKISFDLAILDNR